MKRTVVLSSEGPLVLAERLWLCNSRRNPARMLSFTHKWTSSKQGHCKAWDLTLRYHVELDQFSLGCGNWGNLCMHLSSYFSLEISYSHIPLHASFLCNVETCTNQAFIPLEQGLLPKIKLLTLDFWAVSRTHWSDPGFTGFMWKIKTWFYWVAQKMVTNAVHTPL